MAKPISDPSPRHMSDGPLPDDMSLERIIGQKVTPLDNGCWQWTGSTTHGYPTHTKVGMVHRWIYELMVNPIPEGFHVHHECGNKGCVNPDHLRAITPRDHAIHHNEGRRGDRKAKLPAFDDALRQALGGHRG